MIFARKSRVLCMFWIRPEPTRPDPPPLRTVIFETPITLFAFRLIFCAEASRSVQIWLIFETPITLSAFRMIFARKSRVLCMFWIHPNRYVQIWLIFETPVTLSAFRMIFARKSRVLCIFWIHPNRPTNPHRSPGQRFLRPLSHFPRPRMTFCEEGLRSSQICFQNMKFVTPIAVSDFSHEFPCTSFTFSAFIHPPTHPTHLAR